MTEMKLPRHQDNTDLARAASVDSPDFGAPDLPEFREYARKKYRDELDEDLITMIEDLIERQRQRIKSGRKRKQG